MKSSAWKVILVIWVIAALGWTMQQPQSASAVDPVFSAPPLTAVQP